MIRSALFVLALARGALAQQAGTLSPTESHPKLAIQQCSSAGCETLARSIVLDANWRWFDEAGANCFDGYAWAPVCDGDPTCTRVCALEGGNYEGTYGIKAAGHNLTIGFVTRGGSGNNVGSRSYLLSEVIDWLRAGPDRDIPGLLRARQAAEPGLVSDDRSDTIDEWVALNEHMCVVEEGVLSPDGKVFRVGA